MKRITTLATALGALAVIASAATPALASPATPASTATGVSISPTRVELHLVPGHKTRQIYFVTADSSVPMRIYSSEVALVQNAQGHFVPSDSKLPGSVLGTSWVHVTPSSFLLPAHSTRKVVVIIDTPKVVQPGQRYLATMFTAGNAAASGSGKGEHVTVTASVGGEMVLDVPGKTVSRTVFGLHIPFISFGGRSRSRPLRRTSATRSRSCRSPTRSHPATGSTCPA
jgi:hypothetical protein